MKTFLKQFRTVLKKKHNLSLSYNDDFIRNFVVVLGVVFVWRGLWNLIDHYFFPENFLLSNVLTVLIGMFILYLPDKSLHELGGYTEKKKK